MKGPSVISRRELLRKGSGALAALALFESPLFARAWGMQEGEVVIPFLDQPPEPPQPRLAEISALDWQNLSSWITPNEDFFAVGHYGHPEIDARDWQLDITGLVERPMSLSLDQLKTRPRKEVTFTIECAGNHGFPWFAGGIGNARWAGTPLAAILEEAGVKDRGIEVVFFGADEGETEVRGSQIKQKFARSMSLNDATHPDNLLCYEMNGEPLPRKHGHPLRLIVPGWYGIANVKWLERIEVMDTRYMGHFMAEDYVTVWQRPEDEDRWILTSVGRSRIKSIAAKVTVKDGRYRIYGAAWGGPVQSVEVQIDEGDWRTANIDRGQDIEHAWKFWHLDWTNAAPGTHTIRSRATDRAGVVQPTLRHARIATKKTYWESDAQITREIRIE